MRKAKFFIKFTAYSRICLNHKFLARIKPIPVGFMKEMDTVLQSCDFYDYFFLSFFLGGVLGNWF